MSRVIYTTQGCSRCKIAKQFISEHNIACKEVDIKKGGLEEFREVYHANPTSIFKSEKGIEFPVFTDGKEIRQGVGVIVAYLAADRRLDGFIERCHMTHTWLDGLNISEGDPRHTDKLIKVLNFLKNKGLKLKFNCNGRNSMVLERLLRQGLGDMAIMSVKGPLVLYSRLAGVEIDSGDIRKSIELIPHFPEFEFFTTLATVTLHKGELPRYLTLDEVAGTAELIWNASQSHTHPYTLRAFDPEESSDESVRSLKKLPDSALLKYRQAARKFMFRADIEK